MAERTEKARLLAAYNGTEEDETDARTALLRETLGDGSVVVGNPARIVRTVPT